MLRWPFQSTCMDTHFMSDIWFFCFISRSLANNLISSVEGRMFGPGSSISDNLYMGNNLIPVLPDDTFSEVSLTNLDLSNNKLVTYPGHALEPQNIEKMWVETHGKNKASGIEAYTIIINSCNWNETNVYHTPWIWL